MKTVTVTCVCPIHENVVMHFDFCPNTLNITPEEHTAWHNFYGPLEDYADSDVEEYNKRMLFFIHGLRAKK